MTRCDHTTARQAVVLAGGQATRLRPYTDNRPKPLVEVAGMTIFERQVRWLAAGGVEHVVVACGYLVEVFEQFANTIELPVSVQVVREDKPLGRGGGLRFAAGHLPYPEERWMGLNGDVLTDSPAAEICAHHDATPATATVAVARYRCPYGVLDLATSGRVNDFVESPLLPVWINAGIYVFDAAVTGLLPERGDHEDTTFPKLAAAGDLYAYRIEGYWRGIDNTKDLKEAAKELTNRPPLWD